MGNFIGGSGKIGCMLVKFYSAKIKKKRGGGGQKTKFPHF